MEDNKVKGFSQVYETNKGLLEILGAIDNPEIYKAFWDARDPEVNHLRQQVLELQQLLQEQSKQIEQYERTEHILKKEITSSGQHILSLNENVNLQGQEIEKLDEHVQHLEEVNQDLRFVISEQKSEKQVYSQKMQEQQEVINELNKEIVDYNKRESAIKRELQEIKSRTDVIEQTSREQIQFLINKNEQLEKAIVERDDLIEQSKRYAQEYRNINTRLSDELMRLKHKVKQVQSDGPMALLSCH